MSNTFVIVGYLLIFVKQLIKIQQFICVQVHSVLTNVNRYNIWFPQWSLLLKMKWTLT